MRNAGALLVACALASATACGGAVAPGATTPVAEDPAADLKLDPNGGPPLIQPDSIMRRRTAGVVNIHPPGPVLVDMSSRGGGQLLGSFKFCVDEHGNVASVKPLRSTGYATYDAVIVAHMEQWTYQPYVVDGHAITVCSAATFVFRVQAS